jgi:NAD(P)H-dependent FMN reductase
LLPHGSSPEGVELELVQGLDDLPHYSEDADGELAQPAVRQGRAALGAADGVLVREFRRVPGLAAETWRAG